MKIRHVESPRMPVLEQVCQRVGQFDRSSLHSAVFIFTAHLLGTAITFFKTLFSLGTSPDQVYVLGKFYSSNIAVAEKLRAMGVLVLDGTVPKEPGGFSEAFSHDVAILWKRLQSDFMYRSCKTVIVVDDGGHCITTFPPSSFEKRSVVGIEQTTSGIRRLDVHAPFPVIHVASCAAKRYIEPPMISKAILAKLRLHIPEESTPKTCGVIGLGNVGRAVASDLLEAGNRVLVFDRNLSLSSSVPGSIWADGVEEIVSKADYVFGCTGEDIFKQEIRDSKWLNRLRGHKVLMSCSSEDIEFLSLLENLRQSHPMVGNDPLQTFSYRLSNATLSVLRGGFPINFDGSPESVPPMDIQVTLGLMLGGIVQAVFPATAEHNEKETRGLMLDPAIQRFVVTQWLKLQPSRTGWYSDSTVRNFTDLNWIRDKSTGHYPHSPILQKMFQLEKSQRPKSPNWKG